MADREQFDTSKRGMDEKRPRDVAGKTGSGSQGDLLKEREHHAKGGGTVGRTVPDQSKEKNTEIAVEAGRKGQHPDDRR